MEGSRFDRFTRFVGTFRSRREVFVTLLAITGLGTAAAGADAAAARRDRRLTAEGPCGNGGPKANRCRRHRDCCTNYCHPRQKRCRCRRRGQTCTSNRNCCRRRGQRLVCRGGRCRPPGPCPPGQTLCNGTCIPNAACCEDTECTICQECHDGACVTNPDTETAICAERSQGAVRCCDGTCPASSCLATGTPCGDAATCLTACCSGHIDPAECVDDVCQCAPRPASLEVGSGPCLADEDCEGPGQCRCGACCVPPANQISGPSSICARCCSGTCFSLNQFVHICT